MATVAASRCYLYLEGLAVRVRELVSRSFNVMGVCASLLQSSALERRYEVDTRQVLGEGTYSVVFRGRARATDAPVAVKRVDKRQHALGRPQLWQAEVALLRQCGEHPHVIALRDVFDTPAHVFIVMELAEGGELFQALISEGAYSEWDAKRFMRQIVQALQFLHERNIVHRDIKPENLLLTSSDARSAAIKLADFGMATLVNDASFLSAKHLSWAYCAPEVLRAYPALVEPTSLPNAEPQGAEQGTPAAAVGVKSDMWSLGIVLYVLLSGIHPFDPDGRHTREQIIASIQEGTFSISGPLWDPISSEAKAMLSKLLSPHPEDRPSAVEALRHEWFDTPHTPRESLRVSVTNGLGAYQRLMRRKFRASVFAALAANNFRRSLEKSRGSRSSSVKDGLSVPTVAPEAESRAPDATGDAARLSDANVVPVLATSSASIHTSDITISEVGGSAPATASPQHESAPYTPMSALGRVLQRMPSSDAVDPSITDTGSAPLDTVAVEINND